MHKTNNFQIRYNTHSRWLDYIVHVHLKVGSYFPVGFLHTTWWRTPFFFSKLPGQVGHQQHGAPLSSGDVVRGRRRRGAPGAATGAQRRHGDGATLAASAGGGHAAVGARVAGMCILLWGWKGLEFCVTIIIMLEIMLEIMLDLCWILICVLKHIVESKGWTLPTFLGQLGDFWGRVWGWLKRQDWAWRSRWKRKASRTMRKSGIPAPDLILINLHHWKLAWIWWKWMKMADFPVYSDPCGENVWNCEMDVDLQKDGNGCMTKLLLVQEPNRSTNCG